MERDRGAHLRRPACVSCRLGEDRPWGGNLSLFTRPYSALGMSSLCKHIPIPMGKQLHVPTLPPRINPVPWPRVTLQEGHVVCNNPTIAKSCSLNGAPANVSPLEGLAAVRLILPPAPTPHFPLPSLPSGILFQAIRMQT